MPEITAPDWNSYTSIFEWFNNSMTEFLRKHGYMANQAILPQEIWDKVSKNHFITIPGSNYFFGLEVKIGPTPEISHIGNSQYET